MSLPVLLEPAAVASYFGVSEDTLARWRAAGEGPLACKIGQRVVYTEQAVAQYIEAQLTGNKAATPAAIQAAFVQGRAGVRVMQRERVAAMQSLDKADRDSVDGVTPLVMGIAGQGPQDRFERHFNVPATPVEQPAPPHILSSR